MKKRRRRMWEKGGYVAYKYDYLNYSDEPIIYNDFPSVKYNDDLCPSKGDKAFRAIRQNWLLTF